MPVLHLRAVHSADGAVCGTTYELIVAGKVATKPGADQDGYVQQRPIQPPRFRTVHTSMLVPCYWLTLKVADIHAANTMSAKTPRMTIRYAHRSRFTPRSSHQLRAVASAPSCGRTAHHTATATKKRRTARRGLAAASPRSSRRELRTAGRRTVLSRPPATFARPKPAWWQDRDLSGAAAHAPSSPFVSATRVRATRLFSVKEFASERLRYGVADERCTYWFVTIRLDAATGELLESTEKSPHAAGSLCPRIRRTLTRWLPASAWMLGVRELCRAVAGLSKCPPTAVPKIPALVASGFVDLARQGENYLSCNS